MPPVTVTAEVDRPAAEVYAYATDPSRFREWQKGVVSGHMVAEERCVTVRRIGFADRPSTAEVVHRDPPRSWRVRGVDGPIRAMVDVEVAPIGDDRARLTIAVDFEGHGIGRLLVPLVVRPEARKEMPANIAVLKQRLENR
jgi:carbon monoxide dehydrogenase subunit G